MGGNPDLGLDACEIRDQEKFDKPIALTLSLGAALSNVINTTQDSGKVEVSSTGAVDNDSTVFIRVTNDDDPNKTDKVFFGFVISGIFPPFPFVGTDGPKKQTLLTADS